MIDSTIDIESIVREVVRRLKKENDRGNNEAGNGTNGTGNDVHATKLQKAETGTLRLSHRVISLAQLDEQLQGVRRLVVPPRAIVTPAVHDELRRKGITLQQDEERTPVAGESDSRWRIYVGCHDTAFDANLLLSEKSPIHGDIELIESGKLEILLREFARRLPTACSLGLVVSSTPHEVACQANRSSVFRAAVVGDTNEAEAVCQTLHANLLAVYDTGVSRVREILGAALQTMCEK